MERSVREEEPSPFGDLNNEIADSLVGRIINQYRIEARLGSGAMAAVYRAVDQRTGTAVALKILLPSADRVLRERFRNEARTVSMLHHPHIVPTLEVGQNSNDTTFIVMALIEGESLGTLLERVQQLSVMDACRLLAPIAQALAYAHQTQVVHRDVKPSNILLQRVKPSTPNSVQISPYDFAIIPLLSDFGIARALDAPELTTAGRTIGTPSYMAPEQCSGNRDLDGRADIYSLGTVFYRCLVGRPPYAGTTTQILHAHVYEPLTIPDNIARQLPPVVLQLLRRALQKNPEQRQRDAAALANEFVAIIRKPDSGRIKAEDITTTMPDLMATMPAVESTTSQILVNGAPQDLGKPIAPPFTNVRPGVGLTRTPTRPMPVTSPPPAPRRAKWMALAVGALLTVALVMVAGVIISQLVPFDWEILPSIVEENANFAAPMQSTEPPTPIAIAEATVTGAPIQEATEAISTEQTPLAATATATATVTLSTPQPIDGGGGTLPPIVPSTTVTTTNLCDAEDDFVANVESVWDDALSFYTQRAWGETRRNLTLIFRTERAFNFALCQWRTAPVRPTEAERAALLQKILFENPSADLWEKGRNIFKREEVQQMLFDSYVGLALLANQGGTQQQVQIALDYYDAALALKTNAQPAKSMRDATAAYLKTLTDEPQNQENGAQTLALAYQQAAASLSAPEEACNGVELLKTALQLAFAPATEKLLEEKRQQCAGELITTPTPMPETINPFQGSILYSTQAGGSYRIYKQSLTENNLLPQLLLENASQPQLSPNGLLGAFYNLRPGSDGLSAFNFTAPDSTRALRFTKFVEDGRASPPSWSPDGNRLVFSSDRSGDKKFRIYIAIAAPGNPNEDLDLGPGEDPAWRPTLGQADWIVYQGVDKTGNQPGLWLMDDKGNQLQRLTTSTRDRRPAWSRDGKYVLFMRDNGADEWDLYRLTIADGTQETLANSSAKEGLPTVSPNGEFVAFMSDLGGVWQLWVVPIEGGEAKPVAPIQGELTNWLEHTIQWVE